jgi:tryptophan 2-monooxygenase
MAALDTLTSEHQREYLATGKISDPAFVLEAATPVVGFPECPFDYGAYLRKVGRIGTIPDNGLETEIAVIGAGTSGLCAAYELMKVGLRPVIYEATGRIGGRTWSKPAAKDPNVVLEMGAMRVPTSHRTFQFYADEFEIKTGPFPNPGTVDTMLCFDGSRTKWLKGTAPPDFVSQVVTKLAELFGPALKDLNLAREPNMPRSEFVARWEHWVERYQYVSFLEALLAGGSWSATDLAVLGAFGAGTGGLEAQLRSCFLELVRAALGSWDQDQLVLGGRYGRGIQSLANSFWSCPAQTACGVRTLRELQAKSGEEPAPRPAVVAIRPATRGGRVEVTDASGATETYPAAILSCTTRAAEMGISIDDTLFSRDVWRALRRIHYVDSTRILCRSSAKFWQGGDVCQVTLTDRPTRATYLLDYGPDVASGVCLLSYTWGDDSTKFLALEKQEQVDLCLSVLDGIYGAGAFSKQDLDDFEVISWQQERGFNGGFKLTFPGQYDDNAVLYSQYREGTSGLVLAGEGVSWAGGWIEGALQSGLNAAFAVQRLVGGQPSAP